MNELNKLGLLRTISWSIVGIIMIVIFSGDSAITDFGDNINKTILLSVLIAFGLLVDLIVRIVIKRKGLVEEINYKSMNVGMVVTLLYVFLITITLYTYYEGIGVVPVGWLWIIAYSTIVFVNITMGVCDLIFRR